MFIAGEKLKNAFQPNSAKVYHFDEEQGLSHDQVTNHIIRTKKIINISIFFQDKRYPSSPPKTLACKYDENTQTIIYLSQEHSFEQVSWKNNKMMKDANNG